MKAWELEVSKIYTCDGYFWKVLEKGGPLCTSCLGPYEKDNYVLCSSSYTEIAKKNFEEYTDWSKVKVDTKVLVRESEDSMWLKRYFKAYNPSLKAPVEVFSNGSTSWSRYGVESYGIFKLDIGGE